MMNILWIFNRIIGRNHKLQTEFILYLAQKYAYVRRQSFSRGFIVCYLVYSGEPRRQIKINEIFGDCWSLIFISKFFPSEQFKIKDNCPFNLDNHLSHTFCIAIASMKQGGYLISETATICDSCALLRLLQILSALKHILKKVGYNWRSFCWLLYCRGFIKWF